MPITLPFRPRRESYPSDMWTQCPGCSEMLFNKHLDKALRVCPTCGHHFRISAPTRLDHCPRASPSHSLPVIVWRLLLVKIALKGLLTY